MMSLAVAKRIQRAAQPHGGLESIRSIAERTGIVDEVRTIPAFRELAYDYTNQAWIVNGRYQRCGHTGYCLCYGKIHHGESPAENAEIR
jgi:hypothetical protein